MAFVKPRIFIGSSSEGIEIARRLHKALVDRFEPQVWDEGDFILDQGTLDSLINATKKYDFAVFVFTPDDTITKREKSQKTPRDNVIFEMGLFIGSLGRDRTYAVHRLDDEVTILSDYRGITIGAYENRSDHNLQAALGPVSVDIADAINGVLNSPSALLRASLYGIM